METMESLRSQIESAEDLYSVVKTMKAIAAAGICQFEQAAQAIDHYEDIIRMGFHILFREGSEIPLIPESDNRPAGVVVFGSAQGMVGKFDEVILSFFAAQMKNRSLPPQKIIPAASGIRIKGGLEMQNYIVDYEIEPPGSVGAITEKIQELLSVIMEWRREKRVETILLYFNRKRGKSEYQPKEVKLMPIDRKFLKSAKEMKWKSHTRPTFTMEWEVMFESLLEQRLFVSLYGAMAQSLAAENAARLAAMQSAQKNIEDRLEELHSEYNHRRQNSITMELQDIVSGYEALRKE